MRALGPAAASSWERRRRRLRETLAGRALLWTLSQLYGLLVAARRQLFRWGLLRARRLPAKVVCIGNLTTGGTGKTPAVLLAAQTLRKRNIPVAIISRGYGRGGAGGSVVALVDEQFPSWTICGDEPWMMHQALHGQGVPILVSADRVKAGEEAIHFYHSKLLILDDGFQHHRLRRDLDIVLVSARDPFGGGSLLPLGDLREPATGLARAQMIVITHADALSDEGLAALKADIHRLNKKAPVLEAVHRPDFLLDVRADRRLKLSQLDGREVIALSGIGEPEAFEAQLAKIGAKISQRWRYPDHHAYALGELRAAERLAHKRALVTTFKDIVRFPPGWEKALSGEVYALSIKLEILKGRNVWIDTLLRLAAEAAGGAALARRGDG